MSRGFRHRLGWPAVWELLDVYLDTRGDYPLTSPLGRIALGGPDGGPVSVNANIMLLVDVGRALDALSPHSLEAVLAHAYLRRQEDRELAKMQNDEAELRRAIREGTHRRGPNPYRGARHRDDAAAYRTERRRLERTRDFCHGMDVLRKSLIRRNVGLTRDAQK